MKIISALILCALLCSCHDTNSYENVRKLKTGMSLIEVKEIMGNPVFYMYINDSTEVMRYFFDIPLNGFDQKISITYINERIVKIEQK